jgi:hypothetical protein
LVVANWIARAVLAAVTLALILFLFVLAYGLATGRPLPDALGLAALITMLTAIIPLSLIKTAKLPYLDV